MNSYYGCVWFLPKTIYALMEIFRELTFYQKGKTDWIPM